MSASPKPFRDDAVDPPVRGFLHTPAVANNHALILAHGAGSNANAPLLIALAETLCSAEFTVLRCDLPYRQVRSWGPPGPSDAARDRAGLKNAIASVRKTLGAPSFASFAKGGNSEDGPPSAGFVGRGSIFLGGHSYGGRQSSMLCAEEPDLVAGLMLLSYPLHPPRKPEQQRTQHLPSLRTPSLFVHGTRDPFGSITEIEQALKMIPAKTKLMQVEGAGHDLGFKGKAKNVELSSSVLSELIQFLSLSS